MPEPDTTPSCVDESDGARLERRSAQLARALGVPESSTWLELLVTAVKAHQGQKRMQQRAEAAEAEVVRLTELVGRYADRGIANGERAEEAEAALARVRQMADAWEQRLPEVIRTATVVDAIRIALALSAGGASAVSEL